MKPYQIIIGEIESPLFSFQNNDIKSCAIESEVNLIGEELTLDVAEIEVKCDDDSIRMLPYATKVQIFDQEKLVNKFYTTEIERIKINSYKLKATSAIGIIANDIFYGDIYGGTSQTIEKVFREIIGTNGLQPYEGYYRGRRIYYPHVEARAIGVYKVGSSVNNRTCLSATMRSRMVTNFTILHSETQRIGDVYGQLLGKGRNVLCGSVLALNDTDETKAAHQYGVYMDVTYNKSTKVWQEYGELFFVYGNTKYSLGTPTDNSSYEIDINPVAGTAVINGTSYAITAPDDDWLIPLHVCSGGTTLQSIDSTRKIIDGGGGLGCYLSCEFGDYKLFSESGKLQCDAVYVKNGYSEYNIYLGYDIANNTYEKNLIGIAKGGYEPIGELIEIDESEHPAFHKKTELEKEILDNLVIDENVRQLIVIGWIKPCTKREALQQLLFSQGIIIKKNSDGNLLITAPENTYEKAIADDCIYIGGSVNYHEPVNAVELTEYGFQNNSGDAVETVYENTIGASGYYVAVFNKSPVTYGTTNSDDLIIACKNANAAIVSGTGSIVARPYRCSESVLKRFFNDDPNGKTINVKEATLVTMHNSQNVLDRMEAYYVNANKVKESIVVSDEMCGSRYVVKTPYAESKEAYLTRKTETLSGIIKSDCEFIIDYEPPRIGEEYSKYVILTGSGTWSVPEEVYEKEHPRIRAILIGGGTGGDGGYAGEDGKAPSGAVAVEQAIGGAGGENGEGGFIFDVTIDNPSPTYQYSCGIGGTGGDISTSTEENSKGSIGGNTEMTDGEITYNSVNGGRSESGTTNFLTGDTYGKKQNRFYNQGKGGDGGYYEMDGNIPQYILPSTVVGYGGYYDAYYGGNYGDFYAIGSTLIATGGAGGGAAFGENGGDGTDATSRAAGSGGKGGDATMTPKKATDYMPKYYGYGGFGGAGGGGGGAAGPYSPQRSSQGAGGLGGYGGHGGDGGDGCVLIYY